ncbi:MAG TPA: ATP-binding protein [Bacteroidetes bacterium]|jgi:anti-sigma regulatory factor (Ser/Thr protein kinase)|nr:ATP-binding protein [Bacteroidota bacterium]
MEDLSLHILDIAENSINAGATNIEITIDEDSKQDVLKLEIADNGSGMDATSVEKALDPFYTTRTTRRVGLGLPFLDEAARAANGRLEIDSHLGVGTKVIATFQLSHIDRKPIGNMADTITTLIAGRPEVDITYRHGRDGHTVSLSTKEIRRQVDGVSLNSAETLSFIRQYLEQEEHSLEQHG